MLIMQRAIDRLEGEYDPERDLIPGAPAVTWADYTLLELVKDLYDEIDQLKEKIGEMNAASKGYESPLVHPEDDAGSWGEYQHIKAQQRS